MEITKIVIIGIVGAAFAVMLKEQKPQMAIFVGLSTALILFLMLLSKVQYVIDVITMTALKINLNPEYIAAIFRMIGISYLVQFGSDACRDAGQTAIASKIELAGKITIVVISIPVLLSLFNMLMGLLP